MLKVFRWGVFWLFPLGFALGCGGFYPENDAFSLWEHQKRDRALSLVDEEISRFERANHDAADGGGKNAGGLEEERARLLGLQQELEKELRENPVPSERKPPPMSSRLGMVGLLHDAMLLDLRSRDALRVVKAILVVKHLEQVVFHKELFGIIWTKEAFESEHPLLSGLGKGERSLIVKYMARDALRAFGSIEGPRWSPESPFFD